MILDTSKTGARIRLEEAADLPAQFYLINARAGRGYRALRAWQTNNEAGVHFEASFALDSSLPQELAHLYQYWLDCAANESDII